MLRSDRRYVEIYVFRKKGRGAEFLCLRRSPGQHLAGVWQPVTGKARFRETSLRAAVRETLEETGIAPRRWWALATMTVFFDVERDSARMLPLFAAEARASARVKLSREHDAYRWLTAGAFAKRVLWETQRRALEAVQREVLSNARLEAALEVTARARTSKPGARAKG